MENLSKLIEEDQTFSESAFKAKVDNIFIQVYIAVMKQDLKKVQHFLSENVYNKYAQKIMELQSKNIIQVYDELNVSNTQIMSITDNEEEFQITVKLLTKYLDYIIDKTTRKYISGNRDVRREKYVTLVLTKTKNAKVLGAARRCDCCGANMDLNKTGICEYCGSVYELKKYDWVVTQIND